MKYFNSINNLSELKKQFRALVIANHPDKGGSTEIMQEINAEFEKKYKTLSESKESTGTTNTGYDNDYAGATAKEYAEHVYNEYNWKGSRYNSKLHNCDLVDIFREWLKKTYPSCKFSVNRKGYNSINVHILKMDFNPFTSEKPLLSYDVNTYHADTDKNLNDRGRDIASNIIEYMNSYNYDNSDSMTDYYDRGFYVGLEFGNNSTPFTVEIPKSRRTGGVSDPEFVRPVGKAHAAIKKALGKAYFKLYSFRKGEMLVLGEDYIYNDTINFHPLCYGGKKTAEKRVLKLKEAGINSEIIGSYIVFSGYTKEIEMLLAEEDRAADQAEKEWNENKEKKNCSNNKENDPKENRPANALTIEVVEYSEKAIAVFGDTKQIKDELLKIGGRFNKHLSYSDRSKRAGWIFPKSKREEVERVCKLKDMDQKEPVRQEETERHPLNDGAYMAFTACVQKRLLSSGYESGRKYIKDKVSRYIMRFDQLRYLAFILSDFKERNGIEIKAGAA